jgi:hypothetical protein
MSISIFLLIYGTFNFCVRLGLFGATGSRAYAVATGGSTPVGRGFAFLFAFWHGVGFFGMTDLFGGFGKKNGNYL